MARAMANYFAEWRYHTAKHAMQKQADKLQMNLIVRRSYCHFCITALILSLAWTCSS